MRKYLSDKMWQTRGMLLVAKERMKEQALKLVKEENGDTNFVSIILIVVIIIALAVIFRDTLNDAMEAVMDKLTQFVSSDGAGGGGGIE